MRTSKDTGWKPIDAPRASAYCAIRREFDGRYRIRPSKHYKVTSQLLARSLLENTDLRRSPIAVASEGTMNAKHGHHEVSRFKAFLVHAVAAMMLAMAFVSAWCGNTLAAKRREVQLACANAEPFCPGRLPADRQAPDDIAAVR